MVHACAAGAYQTFFLTKLFFSVNSGRVSRGTLNFAGEKDVISASCCFKTSSSLYETIFAMLEKHICVVPETITNSIMVEGLLLPNLLRVIEFQLSDF